MCIRLFLPY